MKPIIVIIWLMVIGWLVNESKQYSSPKQQQLTFFLDSNSNNFNSSCLNSSIACANFTQVEESARSLLNNSNILDLLDITIRIRGRFVSCDYLFDFSSFTTYFKLNLIPWEDYNTYYFVKPDGKPICTIFQSSVDELFLENGNIESTMSIEMQKVHIVNCRGSITVNSSQVIIENSDIHFTLNYEGRANTLLFNNSTILLYSIFQVREFHVENSNVHMFDSAVSNFDSFITRNSSWDIYNSWNLFSARFNIGKFVSIIDCEIRAIQALFENIETLQMERVNIRNINYDGWSERITAIIFSNIRDIQIRDGNFTSNKYIGSIFELQGCYDVLFDYCNFYHNVQVEFLKVLSISSTTIIIQNSKFLDNVVTNAIINGQGSYVIFNSEFRNNTGGITGSAISLNNNSFLLVENSIFLQNKANKGGAIYTINSALEIKYSNFTNNEAYYGGAIYSSGSKRISLHFYESTCHGNNALVAGGCVFSNTKQFNKIEGVNSAGYYGKDVATEMVELIVELEDRDWKYQKVTNQTIKVFTGESMNFRIILHDEYDQKTSKLQDGELSVQIDSSQTFTLQRQDIASGNESILLSNTQILLQHLNDYLKSTNLRIKFNNLEQSIRVQVVECPQGYSMTRNFATFKCEKIPLEIIIPTAILGAISIIIILIALIMSGFYIIKKLKKLRKQEKAEKEIQKKFTNNNFVFNNSASSDIHDLNVPLIESVNTKESPYQFTIPIDEIKIISKIGEGANGVVYKAKWNRTDVAIKQLKTSGEEDIDEFEREALLMSSLRHPSVVSCFGVSLSLNTMFMVVEYLENGSLEKALYNSKIGREKLSFESKLRILTDVAKGMTYLHSIKPHRIIHRDLKPGNILLTKNMNAKVADFGLSKMVSNNTATMTTNVGTLLYIAPELLSNYHKGQTTKLDVYSFGIIMWEMLLEMTPFSNEISDTNTPFSILLKVITGHRPSLVWIGDKFENVNEFIQERFTSKEIQTFGIETMSNCLKDYVGLMKMCWHTNPGERPEFIQITESLESIIDLLNES